MPKSYKRGNKRKRLVLKVSAAKRKNKVLKKRSKGPTNCNVMKEQWDTTKTVSSNLAAMGLSSDVNKTVALPKNRIQAEIEIADLTEIWAGEPLGERREIPKKQVVNALEEAAKKRDEELKSRSTGKNLSTDDVRFCSEMIRRHGMDFEAMARDQLNIFQNTAKQLKRKIEVFKRSQKFKKICGDEKMEE
uniref:Nucleolar protein 16 n=1 Tax=Panagrolaimus sp. JU765 TaxID=591449 RepID=A0AC34QNV4_9BILA